MTCYSRLLGTGGYLPKTILTNAQLSERLDTTDKWITERTGIRARHVAAQEETASSMAEVAAQEALAMANIPAHSLDLIIVATSTPDRVFPSTACLLQHRLGIRGTAAFDIQAACSGFIFALSVADQYIRAGNAHTVLVVGSEINSRLVNWADRSTCILFGDGAGAVVLGSDSVPGILGTHIHSDGQYQNLLYVPNPFSESNFSLDTHYLTMQGNEVFKVAVHTLEEIVDETLASHQLTQHDIDWLVPHQANLRIITATAKKLKIPMERVVLTIENQGNTSAASIPLALNEAIRDERIRKGQTVLMEAFGAGFVWGSALLRY